MELEGLSLVDLRNLAKEAGLEGYSKLKKSELIEKLIEEYKRRKKEEKGEEESPVLEQEVEQEQSQDKVEVKVTGEDEIAEGILEVLPDGYGFLRGENYLSTPKDVYLSPVQIRRFKLDTGDKVKGIKRKPNEGDRFPSLIYVSEVNGMHPENAMKRKAFDDLVPIYATEKLKLETKAEDYTMRIMDLI